MVRKVHTGVIWGATWRALKVETCVWRTKLVRHSILYVESRTFWLKYWQIYSIWMDYCIHSLSVTLASFLWVYSFLSFSKVGTNNELTNKTKARKRTTGETSKICTKEREEARIEKEVEEELTKSLLLFPYNVRRLRYIVIVRWTWIHTSSFHRETLASSMSLCSGNNGWWIRFVHFGRWLNPRIISVHIDTRWRRSVPLER